MKESQAKYDAIRKKAKMSSKKIWCKKAKALYRMDYPYRHNCSSYDPIMNMMGWKSCGNCSNHLNLGMNGSVPVNLLKGSGVDRTDENFNEKARLMYSPKGEMGGSL